MELTTRSPFITLPLPHTDLGAPQAAAPLPPDKGRCRTVALIPAYNESRFIGSIVIATRPYVDAVLVVDDGSSDQTAEIASRAGAVVLRHERNQGKTAAINTGFGYVRQLSPEALIMLDGDGQHDASDIPSVLSPILAGAADIVVGSRFMEIRSAIPTYRQFGQHSLTAATNLASGVRISDSQSGYRAFSRHAVDELFFGQSGFSVESEMQFLAREHRLRVAEAPIHVSYAEPAKRNPVGHGAQVLNAILRLVGQKRPLLFFGACGSGLLALGLMVGAHVVDVYARTQELAVGLALITVMLAVIGILLLFAGVMLHSTRAMLLDMRRELVTRLSGERGAP